MRSTLDMVVEFAEGIVSGANISHFQEYMRALNTDDEEVERTKMNVFLQDLHHFRIYHETEENWRKRADSLFYDIIIYRIFGLFTTNPTQAAVDMLNRENAELKEENETLRGDNKTMAGILKDAAEGKEVSYRK